MKFLAAMMFLWAIIHASFNTDMWRGWRWFCRIVGHRWYFVISTPTLERREQYCIRCGIIGHWKPALSAPGEEKNG